MTTMSLEQTCEALGCKRSRVFELLSDGILERAPRYGRGLRVFTASVERALRPPPVKGRKRRVSSPAGFELKDIPL
jgi:hypothetical protein